MVVLSGTAGVGKTALAVHWAHQVAAQFPDGQLYVNLQGFDPGGTALEPSEAVRGFLEAFGMPATRIPAALPAQAGLFRSLLAGKRVLMVLDNAHDAGQVRPLLPGSPGCLAIVTSRDRLAGLVAREGAHPLTLDLLPAADARELLARRLGSGRVDSEPAAVDDIIAGCARLPLALTIAAARAASTPGFPLAVYGTELRGATRALDPLPGGDPATDVRAVFSWSYRALSDPAARMFRLLGLHPGPDISLAAAASLAAAPLSRARVPLDELTQAHLLAEHIPGRYTCHDLLRAYAAEQALADGTPEVEARAGRLTGTGVAWGSVVPFPTSPRGFNPQPRTPGRLATTACPAAGAAAAGAAVPAMAAAAAAAMIVTACTPRRALPPMISTGSFPLSQPPAAKCHPPRYPHGLWQRALERR